MKDDIQIPETIDLYLSGAMPEEERVSFEKRMAQDPELSTLVRETEYTNEALHYAGLGMLKAHIGEDLKHIKYKPYSSVKNILLLSVAGILAGAGAFLILNENTKEPVPESIPLVITDTLEEAKKPIEHEPDVIKDSSIHKNIQRADYNTTVTPEKEAINPSPSEEVEVTAQTEEFTDSTEDPVSSKEKPTDKDIAAIDIKPDSLIQHKKILAEEKKPDNCNIVFELRSESSCKQKPTGSIIIDENYEGEYNLELNGISVPFSGGKIKEIPAGKHEVLILYGDCTFKDYVTVGKKYCPLNLSFSFNPDYGEKWEIQYEEGDEGSFFIYNSLGREIFTSNFGSGNEYWDGMDANGNPAPVGTYLVLIKYNNKQTEKVELTIVR